MRKFHKYFLAFFFVPPSIAATFLSSSVIPNKTVELAPVVRPYVVDVIDTNGSETGRYKGLSQSTDAFTIAGELGADPNLEDKFVTFPEIRMGIGSKITLYRAPEFSIKDSKKTLKYRSWVGTVGDLLSEQNIELGLDDKINFAPSTSLGANMQIVITRVAKTTVVESETIKFNVVKKSNPNLEKGTKNILQSGKNGSKNKYYLVTREDGEEISRKLTKSEIVTQPIDEIDEVGTKVVVYGTGTATWYTRKDKMVAAHNSLPKGTKVRVVNLSNGKACVVTIDDRGIQGSAIIDLSADAFASIGALGTGVLNVRIEKYYPDN